MAFNLLTSTEALQLWAQRLAWLRHDRQEGRTVLDSHLRSSLLEKKSKSSVSLLQVGIIGTGRTGKVAARIFSAGCSNGHCLVWRLVHVHVGAIWFLLVGQLMLFWRICFVSQKYFRPLALFWVGILKVFFSTSCFGSCSFVLPCFGWFSWPPSPPPPPLLRFLVDFLLAYF